jgi:UDP-N-acetylmuramate--alanine ligase
VVTDIYAAREDPEPGIDGALVANAARHARPDLDCVYEPDRPALAARVASLVEPGDLVLTLGAGDITTLADELAPLLGPPGRGGAVDGPAPSTRRSATLPPRGARPPADGGDP